LVVAWLKNHFNISVIVVNIIIFLVFPESNVFVTIRVDSSLTYNVSVSVYLLASYNLTVNRTNDVTKATFAFITKTADSAQLVAAVLSGICNDDIL